ncbi:hypothetical protein [Glaciecola sp. 1036]|uniref:hypothetical protein n=1 Tax=Alteromonadaceae TaxID=72275 RepID=UPI003CFD7D43
MLETKSLRDLEILNSEIDYNEKLFLIEETLKNFENDFIRTFGNKFFQEYQEFEMAKATELHNKRTYSKMNQFFSNYSNLSDAQKKDIERIYQSISQPTSIKTIGVHGTRLESFRHNVIFNEWYIKELSRVTEAARVIVNSG